MATEKEEIIITLDFDTDDGRKRAGELTKSITGLTKAQKELRKQGQEGSQQFQRNAEALRAQKGELREVNKTTDNLTKANKANAGSNDQLKAQLSLLTAEYNKLSKEERESGARGQELNAQINQTTETLKENEEGVGNNTRSVGDYGKALGGTPFGSFIGGIKGMGAAFLANPIGLIITAIVLALKALFEAFKSTEAGENKIAKATAIVSTIFSKLFDLLEPLAGFIVDVLAAGFEFLTEKIDEAAKGLEASLEFFGFGEAAKGLQVYREELIRTAEAAALIADARAQTDKIDRELIVQTAKVAAQAADARQKALEDETIPAEERNRLLNEAAEAIDALAAKEEKSAQLKFKALQLENSLTNSNKEALDAQAEAEAALFEVQRKRSDAQKGLARDQLRVENEIKKARQDRVKASQDAVKEAISQSKAELDLFLAQQGIRAKTLAEEVATAEQVRDKKLAILDAERKAGLVSETEFQTEKLKIQQDFLELQTVQVIDNANRELQAIVDANQSKIEAGQFLNDELFAQEQDRLQKILEAQLAFEQERLDQGVISQTEFNEAINGANAENAQAVADLELEKKEADAEQRLVDLENQREIDLENGLTDFELRQEELNRQKAQELANAESTGADKALIEAKFAKFNKKLEKETRQAQINEAIGAFNAIAGLAAGNAAAEKALAIASSLINAYQGITAVLAAKSTIPEPIGSIVKGVSAAAIGASALINVNKIRSTKVPTAKKAARGMATILGGDKHSAPSGGVQLAADGVPFAMAEKGELLTVVNAKNTSLLRGLSNLNAAGGNGDPFMDRGGALPVYQDGGIAIDDIAGATETNLETTAQIIAAVESLPPSVVFVQDIAEKSADAVEVEVRSQLAS